MKSKNKTIKFISTLIVVLLLVPVVLFSRPKQAEAFWFSTWVTDIMTGKTSVESTIGTGSTVTNTAISIKNVAKEVLRQITMTIERKLLQQITKSTINWINSGFHGNPLFIENPNSFFKDIAKYEVKTFVDLIGYNPLKYPFGKDFALNTIYSYKRQFEDNAAYSLSNVIRDPILLRDFRNDFNVGGWNGFLINTQYPQNNYIGFQMIATEQLARKLQGTTFNAAQKVQNTLQQGMGFLSPQTCPSNPKYDNGKNEFLRPTFNYSEYQKNNPYDNPYDPAGDPENYKAYDLIYEGKLHSVEIEWNKTNSCPGGLVNTTPGSVVANQITNAMGSQFRQSELAAALGNSISAVLDALVNHFLDKGLNALASKVNRLPDIPDNWDYYGNTLGSPAGGINTTWDSGPDQEIVLDKFKKQIEGKTDRIATAGEIIGTNADGTDKIAEGGEIISEIGDTGNGTYIPGDIANTEKELALIYNDDSNTPGITQMMGAIWPKTRELDMCLPGPDINWQDRLQKETERNSKELQEKLNEDDADLSVKADLVLKELLFAVNFFKDWINNKMMTTLPRSVIYMDAVDEIETLYQQSNELTDARRLKIQALGRLEAIKNGLDTLTDQPKPGSAGEKIIIKLRKQYDSTRDTIATTSSIDSRQNELDVAKDKYKKLRELIPECAAERLAAGWTNPGGRNSTYLDQGTEENLFCDFPIKGGYPHNSFIGPATTRPQVPMVNGKNVLSWDRWGWFTGSHEADIKLNCDIIYKANVLDYKKDLPGVTTVTDPFDDLSRDPGGGGNNLQCLEEGIYDGDLRGAMDAVLAADPALANSKNTTANGFAFLAKVAANPPAGFNVTDQSLNGNDNPNRGDLLAIWKNGDTKMERYDVIVSSGSGNKTMLDAIATQFTGRIPLNCTSSGGGKGCKCATVVVPGPTASSCNTCAEKGQTDKYQNDVRSAANEYLAAHPGIANKLSYNDLIEVAQLRDGVITILKSRGFNAKTIPDPSGNPYPQVVSIWKNGDPDATVYRVTAGGGVISAAIQAGYCGGHETFAGVDIIPAMCVVGGTYPTPTTTTLPPDAPVITGVSPATIRPGVTTITINGTNLSTVNKTTTTTVQFFYGPTGRATVDGSVNSTKSQVTVLVPAEINTTTAAIKIYRDGTTQSAPYTIQISGTGGGTGITTVAPTSIWSPTQTANGWWPDLSSDGRYVAYGNGPESWVTDLQTRQNWNFSNPADLTEPHTCYGGKWIKSDTLSFGCYFGSGLTWYRYEVKTSDGIPRRTADDPNLVGGNASAAGDGHWVSLTNARIVKDNKILANSSGMGSPSISGNTLVTSCSDNKSICVWNGNTISKRITAKPDVLDTDTYNGYIAYSTYDGGVRGITPSGTDIDLSVVKAQGLSESGIKIFDVNGKIYVATFAWSNSLNKGYILIRPWASKTYTAVETAGLLDSIVYVNNNFIIATHSDTGALRVYTVPNRITTTTTSTTSRLTMTVTGAGTVTDGTDTCLANSTCNKDYPINTNITLTARPNSGATFTGWGGDCAVFGAGLICSGSMSVNRNVTATFK